MPKYGATLKSSIKTGGPVYIFSLGQGGRWYDSIEETLLAKELYTKPEPTTGFYEGNPWVVVQVEDSVVGNRDLPNQILPGEYIIAFEESLEA